MRLLFTIDTKNYKENGVTYIRNSSRCINIKDGKVAMIHSLKYNYYKFPGGGIEQLETKEEALIRETLEEAGLKVIPSSIKEFGYVHRKQKSGYPDVDLFIQDNFYYLCDVEEEIFNQHLDNYEQEEKFTLEYVKPEDAIIVNRFFEHGPKNKMMLEREARVLEILINEGYFK